MLAKESVKNRLESGISFTEFSYQLIQGYDFYWLWKNKKVKAKIRIAAEKEEKEFYGHRATKEWLEDLNQFGTNWQKPFLETAPYLIIVFRQIYDVNESGSQRKNYYVNESVGIASGFLLAALHNAGLATLTHTPSPMNFLGKILDRPENEKAYLLIPVGYPSDNAEVPNIKKKPFSEISKKILPDFFSFNTRPFDASRNFFFPRLKLYSI